MPRHLLLAILLSALAFAVPALAVEPARHSADGGCPSPAEASGPEAAADPAVAPANAPVLAPLPSSQPPQRRTLPRAEAARVPLRWHSFVPGMFM